MSKYVNALQVHNEPGVRQSAEMVPGVTAERPLRQKSKRRTSSFEGKDDKIASRPQEATTEVGGCLRAHM